ncbi:hypothetical protein L6452_24940 [Arctium lappa]|uniref:Uncharacterized protein n=1 Tax=Arctium lappa TaxID=4217 RepID=A0ACB9AAX7_ARCLA|nr:hypothetical protein L6452_24940 [Arctium lappa]
MKEVVDLILKFPKESPVIVLSTMGKTTNKLLMVGEKAASCVSAVTEIDELGFVKEVHHRIVDELGLEKTLITDHLEKLERLLNGIVVLKEFTPRAKDYLTPKRCLLGSSYQISSFSTKGIIISDKQIFFGNALALCNSSSLVCRLLSLPIVGAFSLLAIATS